MLQEATKIFLIAFDAGLGIKFLINFNGYKFKDKWKCIYFFPFLFVVPFVFNDDFDILGIILSIILTFAMMLVFDIKKSTKARCFWSCCLFYGTLMMINSLVYSIFRAITQDEMEELIQSFTIYVSICLVSKCLLWLSTIIYIYIAEKHEKEVNKNKIWELIFTTVFNIFLIIIIMFTSLDNLYKEYSLVASLGMIGLFIGGIIQYYQYALLSSKAKLELEYELLKQKGSYERQLYITSQEQYKKIASIKHDMKGHLMHVAYDIKNENYNEAVGYLEKINGELYSVTNDMVLLNKTLSFIINFKKNIALKKEIKIIAHIENISQTCLNDYDLCSLLGNILDNAIDAEEKETEKNIIIEVFNHLGYQIFLVKNYIHSSILEANPDLTTSKTDTQNHGYGIKQIKNVVHKYNGFIDFFEKDKYFNVQVMIPKYQLDQFDMHELVNYPKTC